MTGKRCTDCRYTKGIGYDFWCGEGHTEYEVFEAETNCPYYKYHDWSKGIPSKTVKRFEVTFNDSDFHLSDNETGEEFKLFDEKVCYDYIADRWNALHEENKELKKENAQFDILIKNNQLAYIDLEKENEQLKKQIGNLEHTRDFADEVCVDCERLEHENEQLKKELKAFREERHKEFIIGNGW